MVFSSILFLLYFLPVFMLVYVLLPQKAKNYWALLVSILFYAWGAPNFLYVVLSTSIIDFYLVQALYKSEQQQRKKLFLTISVLLNLGLLAYFKYANFFIENVNAALGSIGIDQLAWTQVALPIGISFFTFQTLTYAIEVFRNEHPPFERPDHYLLYKLIFPHAIAGPIIRFKSVAAQVVNRTETPDDRLIGLFRFSLGLAKKVLIANLLAKQADLYMGGDLQALSFDEAWVGILAYTFQIYFDFSGYSDMAIGLARMMGFRFPENFDSPYSSASITEFWRRWHITLGAFMRDFLYIPLGGNRVANNHFNDLSRNGVFAFRNQGGNVVEYNRIHNAMQTTIDGGCIHFATMNHLNAPNFIQNNWLYDIWGYEQKPDGNVTRRLANGVFLDWDTSNTTVTDNWIYNSVSGSVKAIRDNWNLVVANNPSSTTPITPPFAADVGPDGTATHGIDLPNNKLTGRVIHYTQSENFSTTGTWTEATASYNAGLFEFKFLVKI